MGLLMANCRQPACWLWGRGGLLLMSGCTYGQFVATQLPWTRLLPKEGPNQLNRWGQTIKKIGAWREVLEDGEGGKGSID